MLDMSNDTIRGGMTNFKATLPFNRMKQFFAAFKKRPHGPALARPKGYIRIADQKIEYLDHNPYLSPIIKNRFEFFMCS